MMRLVRRCVYQLGLRPKPGTVLYSPSAAYRIAAEAGFNTVFPRADNKYNHPGGHPVTDPEFTVESFTVGHGAGIVYLTDDAAGITTHLDPDDADRLGRLLLRQANHARDTHTDASEPAVNASGAYTSHAETETATLARLHQQATALGVPDGPLTERVHHLVEMVYGSGAPSPGDRVSLTEHAEAHLILNQYGVIQGTIPERINDILDTLTANTATTNRFRAELDAARTELTAFRVETNVLRHQLTELGGLADTRMRTIEDAHRLLTEHHILPHDLSDPATYNLTDRIVAALTDRADTVAHLAGKNETIHKLQFALTDARTKLDAAHAEATECHLRINHLLDELDRQKSRIDHQREQLDATRENIERLNRRITDLHTKIGDIHNQTRP